MASGYDGDDFVGLDDDAVRANGAAAQPWDTWLDNAVENNVTWLHKIGEPVSWVPLTNNAGDYNSKAGIRPYTSAAYTSVLVIPWWYLEDQVGIECGLIARVADETGDASSCKLKMERRTLTLDASFPGADDATLANTEAMSPQFQDHKRAISFSPQQDDVVGALVFSVLGVEGTSAVATTLGGGTQYSSSIYKAGDTDFYKDSGASRPNSAALDTQFTGFSLSTAIAEHVSLPLVGGSDDGELIGTTGPTVPVPQQMERYGLSYLQIKGLTLRPRYDDTTRPDKRVFAAQKPLLGEVAVQHALRLDSIYTRPRPIWCGPEGALPDPEASEWPTGYIFRFNRVYGDTSAAQNLMYAGLEFDTVNPKIRVMAYIAPLHLFPGLLADGAEPGPLTPLIEWEHTLTLKRMEDGNASWAAAPTAGATQGTVRHGHAPFGDNSLLCQSEVVIRYPYSGDDPGLGYAYKEGQLNPSVDYSKLEMISFTIDAIYDPASGEPLLLQWDVQTLAPNNADWQDVTDRRSTFFPTAPAARDIDTLALVLVGCTIWEIPQ